MSWDTEVPEKSYWFFETLLILFEFFQLEISFKTKKSLVFIWEIKKNFWKVLIENSESILKTFGFEFLVKLKTFQNRSLEKKILFVVLFFSFSSLDGFAWKHK